MYKGTIKKQKTTINNLTEILPLLNFSEKGDFYMLYVMKRKKDQPEEEKENHQSVRTIKSYCIDSVEYLHKRWDEITQLCEMFKARAYIQVCKQNHKDVSLNMMIELAERIKSDSNVQKNLFDSVVGKMQIKEKFWIVDVDSKNEDYLTEIQDNINSCRPFGVNKIVKIIPTVQGFHLITTRFDIYQFDLIYKNKESVRPDIHKKNPTLLYYPESLSTNC